MSKVFNKIDHSDFLTPERLEEEERFAAVGEHNRTMARLITETYDKEKGAIADIIEYGCGTGWITFYLFNTYKLQNIKYYGFDKSELSIQRCQIKAPQIENKNIQFEVKDIRNFIEDRRQADLVCALNFFKYFTITEWSDLFSGFMKSGKKYALFSMSLTKANDIDDGIDYPHMWINYDKLMSLIKETGYTVTEYVPFGYWAMHGKWIENKSAGIFVCKRLDSR